MLTNECRQPPAARLLTIAVMAIVESMLATLAKRRVASHTGKASGGRGFAMTYP